MGGGGVKARQTPGSCDLWVAPRLHTRLSSPRLPATSHPLATGAKEQPGPASLTTATLIIWEEVRAGASPHHVPLALLHEVEGHSPEHPLGLKGQNHPITTGLVLNRNDHLTDII